MISTQYISSPPSLHYKEHLHNIQTYIIRTVTTIFGFWILGKREQIPSIIFSEWELIERNEIK